MLDREEMLSRVERARSLCSEACYTAALQRRRLRTAEPEDDLFVMRRWADWQFFIVALRRLRRAACIAKFDPAVTVAVQVFDAAIPGLSKIRNVGEHIDEYATDGGNDRRVNSSELQVGWFGANELDWLGFRLQADDAMNAAEALFDAVRDARAV